MFLTSFSSDSKFSIEWAYDFDGHVNQHTNSKIGRKQISDSQIDDMQNPKISFRLGIRFLRPDPISNKFWTIQKATYIRWLIFQYRVQVWTCVQGEGYACETTETNTILRWERLVFVYNHYKTLRTLSIYLTFYWFIFMFSLVAKPLFMQEIIVWDLVRTFFKVTSKRLNK